jgi:hypothetical protein
MNLRVRFPLALLLLGLMCLVGCGGAKSKTYPVEGTVTLDDVPVEGATVTFNPITEGAVIATGRTDDKGVFHLTTYTSGDGAVAGEYAVTISKTEVKAGTNETDMKNMTPEQRMKENAKMMERVGKGEAGGQMAKSKNALPEVYAKADSSQLKAKVPLQDNKVKFPLRKGGGI